MTDLAEPTTQFPSLAEPSSGAAPSPPPPPSLGLLGAVPGGLPGGLLDEEPADVWEAEEEGEPVVLKGLDHASRWAERIASLHAQQEEIRATAQARIDRLQAELDRQRDWMRAEVERIEKRKAWYQRSLVAFARLRIEAQRLSGVRKPDKTLRLAHVTVSAKAQQPEAVIDETALMGWVAAQDRPEWIRLTVRVEPAWGAIKASCHVRGGRLVTEDGEVVPGVEMVERDDDYRVEVIS